MTPIFNDINICMACNANYAEPMRTMIYSVLLHADMSRKYEFIIMSSDLSERDRELLLRMERENVRFQFLEMSAFHELVKNCTKNYISAETNYRLYLFSEEFAQYDRMMYLDCDMQATGDISELYDTDLGGKALAACEEVLLIPTSITKSAIFFDGKPCNADIYRTRHLGLDKPRDYFNAGMLVLDLKRCRQITDAQRAVEVLTAHRMQFNDQDALNIIFKGEVKQLDIRYNYLHAIEETAQKEQFRTALAEVLRDDPLIVHYAGPRKPWNSDVPLAEIYTQNNSRMKQEERT